MSLSDKAENMGGTKNWFFEEDVKEFIRLRDIQDIETTNIIRKMLLDNKRDWNNHGEIISLVLNELEIGRRRKDKLVGDKLNG